MKAEQNIITGSRWKKRWRKGTERRKPLWEKSIAKTKTYDSKGKKSKCQPFP